MTRGEVWLAEVGRKARPVLILTRPEVLEVRQLVTVAEITTSIRGLAVEVEVDREILGHEETSVINCDGLHTITQKSLTRRIGELDGATLERVCEAIGYALGC